MHSKVSFSLSECKRPKAKQKLKICKTQIAIICKDATHDTETAFDPRIA